MNRHFQLALRDDTALLQLDGQRPLINSFLKTRAYYAMHLHRTADNPTR
ncbi:hypothetical protein ACVWYF_003766 [Hymenobacter sp. UYAg731]